MIAYDLQCTNGHSFEGWFEDRKSYLNQKKKGLISCPVCNDTTVDNVPSTFAIKSSQAFKPKALSPDEVSLAKIGKEAIEFVQPYGLDLCSGVRTDGVLDSSKMKAFFTAVNEFSMH